MHVHYRREETLRFIINNNIKYVGMRRRDSHFSQNARVYCFFNVHDVDFFILFIEFDQFSP